MKAKLITVEAARTQAQVENGQCDLVQEFDTIAEAKERAKYYLTEQFMRVSEANETLDYARVIVNGECVADYFSKLVRD